jgi:hypothetical protein
LSFTLIRINQDASGKQTVNRTYWSTRKKVNQPDKNIGHLMRKESEMAAKSTRRNARKEDKAGEKFTQMSLFPTSK